MAYYTAEPLENPASSTKMRLALYQPDIPPNTGTILRLAACMAVPVDIIEPCGFPFSDKGVRRAGMDYLGHVEMVRHLSWDDFLETRRMAGPAAFGRIVLLTTHAETVYTDFAFRSDDILLLGRESSGVPEDVHRVADACVKVPMASCVRSLNVAVAAAMVLGEAMRQTGLMGIAADDNANGSQRLRSAGE